MAYADREVIVNRLEMPMYRAFRGVKKKIARELAVHDFAPNIVFTTRYISMCYRNFRGKNAVNVITLYIFLIKFN